MANIDTSTPQMKAFKNWTDAITSLDISKVVPVISKNFKYQSFPKTVDLPEIHAQEKEAHIQWFGGLTALMTKYEIIIYEVIEAPGKIVVHGTAVFSLIDGTTYEYDTVCINSLVEEDGEIKILECKDFSDPHKRSAFYAAIAKLAAQGRPAA